MIKIVLVGMLVGVIVDVFGLHVGMSTEEVLFLSACAGLHR